MVGLRVEVSEDQGLARELLPRAGRERALDRLLQQRAHRTGSLLESASDGELRAGERVRTVEIAQRGPHGGGHLRMVVDARRRGEPKLAVDQVALCSEQTPGTVVDEVALDPDLADDGVESFDPPSPERAAELRRAGQSRVDRQVGVARVPGRRAR